MGWEGYIASIGKTGNAYKILVGKPEGRRPLEKPVHKWEDIKTDLKDIGYEGVEWIQVAQAGVQ
jgi:hypothetical protein